MSNSILYSVKIGGYGVNVRNIENLFNSIKGDMDTIMGLPIKKIKEYLSNLK